MGISKIWVFGEANEAGASAGTLELLTKARTLADTVEVVMVGDASAVAGDLGAHGATTVAMSEDTPARGGGTRQVGVGRRSEVGS